ncbi:restriction endonuclease subunit S [Romboutsia maritimum]|uniref:Restriction endonuclease subunit S n=1 Tax=Romboutsia maritimum TaxID=2020948 RepID=A0A371IQF7_9FIRM|nr:restriction endonuclease subunit S [Romboutsia maritimum]RDY22702.1 restriction endonuclease subunit S [Romboutsia maritimum]
MEFIKLDDLCSIITDGTHQTPTYSNDGYIFLSSKNVTSGKIDWNNVKYIPEQLHEKLSKRLKPQINDILLAKNGTTGVAALVDRDEIFDIYVSLALLRPKGIIYPQYLLHAINSPMTKRQFNKNLKGIGVQNLHLKEIRNIEIPVPTTIDSQIKIVKVLDKAGELIDKRKEQIKRLDELVKSRFIELFGDPSKNEKGWEVSGIGKYLKVLTDYHSNGSYETLRDNVTLLDTPSYALMVRTTDLEKNNFEDDVKYIDEHAYNHLEKSKVFGGEIIINKIGSAGKVYLMPFLNRPVSLAMNQFLLRFDENKVNHIFLYNLLSTSYMEIRINEKVRGAVTKTITKDAIREVNIIVPPIELQNKFVDFVKQVDKLKFKMEKSLQELENNFNSLMQKAFKGELFN